MVAHAATSPLPPLSPEDKRLLRLYFQTGQNTQSLADELIRIQAIKRSSPDSVTSSLSHCVTSSPPDEFDLSTWATSEPIALHIAYRKSELIEARREEALEELTTLVKHGDSPLERRRAATTLLRALSNQLTRTTTREPRTHSSLPLPEGGGRGVGAGSETRATKHPKTQLHTTSSHAPWRAPDPFSSPSPHPRSSAPSAASSPHSVTFPPPIPEAFSTGELPTPPNSLLPNPARTPEELVQLALHAIQSPDDPTPGSGPLNLFNLHGILSNRTTQAFHHFKANYLTSSLNAAWKFRSAGSAPITQTPKGLETLIPITLNDESVRKLKVELRFSRTGPLAGCWIIHQVMCLFSLRNTS